MGALYTKHHGYTVIMAILLVVSTNVNDVFLQLLPTATTVRYEGFAYIHVHTTSFACIYSEKKYPLCLHCRERDES